MRPWHNLENIPQAENEHFYFTKTLCFVACYFLLFITTTNMFAPFLHLKSIRPPNSLALPWFRPPLYTFESLSVNFIGRLFHVFGRLQEVATATAA